MPPPQTLLNNNIYQEKMVKMKPNIRNIEIINTSLTSHIDLFSNIPEYLFEKISDAGDACLKALSDGRKILLCGNGGSAADAQHIAAELTGRFVLDRKPLAGISLTTDSSALTCISNDYSFNDVFSRQVMAIGSPGDVLIGISTSGNSENVVRAIGAAKDNGLFTIALLGNDGGKIKEFVDIDITVNSTVTARIQEFHIFIGHTICQIIDANICQKQLISQSHII